MQETLKIVIIQSDLVWEDPFANRATFYKKIQAISSEFDLIVLPEMFTTGFSMNAPVLAEDNNGKTLEWMIEIATHYDTAITGSIIINENNLFYNRLFFVYPNGSYDYYDKRHTFTLAGEDETYTSGTRKLIVEYKGFKICPLICYDLRFPVWSRNTEEYDILLYVANWPARRITAWDALLKARAIENMSYCIGVNRVGRDGNNHEYIGHSAAYDVLGNQVSTHNFEEEFVETIHVEKEHIDTNRKHLQFLKDRDAFSLG